MKAVAGPPHRNGTAMVEFGVRFRRRPWAMALAGYAVGCVVLTFPLLFRLSRGIETLPAGDPGQHFWNIWWLENGLTDPEARVFWTDYVFHPVGTGLAYHAYHPLLSLFVFGLRPFFGAIPAYNLVLIAGPLLSAWGLYLCAREWGAPPRAAWLAGFLFLFAPFRSEIWVHWEIQSTQWIPFYLLFLHRAVLRGGWGNIVGCALFLIMTALTAWYHVAALLLLSCIAAPALVWAGRDPKGSRRRLARLLGAAGLTLLLFSPYLRVLMRQRGAAAEVPQFEAMHHWSCDVLHYVLPVPIQKAVSPLLERPYYRFPAHGNHLVYPGTAVWILAAASVILLGRRARSWSLLAAAGLLLVLSLGPMLKCGTLVTVPKIDIPVLLPGYLVLRKIPLLSALRTTCRLGIGVTPLLALFAALNWEGAISRLPKALSRRENLIIGGACLVALVEGWSAPIATHPVNVPAIYGTLAGDGDDVSVIEAPCTAIADLARSMYYQTFHEHRLVGGYLARPVPVFEAYAARSPLIVFLRDPASATDYVFAPAMRRRLLEECRSLRLRYIVVHGDRLVPAEREGIEKLVTKVLECRLIDSDGPHLLYRVPVE